MEKKAYVIVRDTTGIPIPHKQVVGRYTGVLQIGCFSAGIRLDSGIQLCFQSPVDVPKELWPQRRGEDVPVLVTIRLNELEQIEYDAVKL